MMTPEQQEKLQQWLRDNPAQFVFGMMGVVFVVLVLQLAGVIALPIVPLYLLFFSALMFGVAAVRMAVSQDYRDRVFRPRTSPPPTEARKKSILAMTLAVMCSVLLGVVIANGAGVAQLVIAVAVIAGACLSFLRLSQRL